MQLTDEDGRVRSSFFGEAFTPEQSSLLQALSERFVLRFFRFSDGARRVDGVGDMTFDGTHTNLANALDAARSELSGVPLSGLVMVTDGADTGERPLTEAIVPLQAAGVVVPATNTAPGVIRWKSSGPCNTQARAVTLPALVGTPLRVFPT